MKETLGLKRDLEKSNEIGHFLLLFKIRGFTRHFQYLLLFFLEHFQKAFYIPAKKKEGILYE